MSKMDHKGRSELAELTALSALEALPREERTAAEWKIAAAGESALSELEELRVVAAEIGLSAEPAEPSAKVRDRLLAAIDEETEEGQRAPAPGVMMHEAGLLISSSDQIPWKPHGVPGVAVKTLFYDKASGQVTSLVRMDPNTEYPAHRHGDAEELFVLWGDVQVHGQNMGPGDYCRAETDSVHQPTRTEHGVVFLAKTSAADELLH